MRMLVLGGSAFVSRAIVALALAKGNDVVAATRGNSGSPPAGARHVRVDRSKPDGLAVLADDRFDAVVDVARMHPAWVRDALRTIKSPHWTFVSSMSVYDDDHVTPGQTATTAAVVPEVADPEPGDPRHYGGAKLASERLVIDQAERAFVVRPGLVAGTGDPSDRYGYWPARLSRGGQVLVPAPADDPVQLIDVADLAEWIVSAAEERIAGVYDAVSPPMPMSELLRRTARGIDAPPHELVALDENRLRAAGVGYYMGPRSLPLWAPMRSNRLLAHDVTPSLAAGLRIRPIERTAAAALAHEQSLGLDRPRAAGLSQGEEAELLAS